MKRSTNMHGADKYQIKVPNHPVANNHMGINIRMQPKWKLGAQVEMGAPSVEYLPSPYSGRGV
jgi:hypothetical protein